MATNWVYPHHVAAPVAAAAVVAPARPRRPRALPGDADRTPPQQEQGRLNVSLRMYLEPKEGVQTDFRRGLAQPARLPVRAQYARRRLAQDEEMYGQLLPYVMHRADLNYLLDIMGARSPSATPLCAGGDMPALPYRRAGCWVRTSPSTAAGIESRASTATESWNPDLRAPLAEPGASVSTGDYILAINGVELRAPDNIYRLLDGTPAGRRC